MSRVLVSLVLHNDGNDLPRCLESVRAQTAPARVRVFDNASRDNGAAIAGRMGAAILRSPTNLGFSAGHNANLREFDFDWALLLNADTVLSPQFLEKLLQAAGLHPQIGMVGGKLLRLGGGGNPALQNGKPVIDSTGIYFTPALRHFDRGSGAVDVGQFDRCQLVFGITGAAVLCSRQMLEDLKLGGEILDEDFFAFREDADLAWRAQLRGWKAVYEPSATALHRRRVVPERRSELPALINYHSLKNRYLMRIKNMDWAIRLRCFPFMWTRDAAIFAYVLARERTSLAAYRRVLQLRKKFEQKRKVIQGSRLISPREMASWFAFRPTAVDLEA